MQALIRLLLLEQSDLGLHCLLRHSAPIVAVLSLTGINNRKYDLFM